jgi:hypothetical protein
MLWIRIRIDFSWLEPYPDLHWECGSGRVQKGKKNPQKWNEISCFDVLDVIF